jgi:hypothetical protein
MGNEKITTACVAQTANNLARVQAIAIGFYRRPCPRSAATGVESTPVGNQRISINLQPQGRLKISHRLPFVPV